MDTLILKKPDAADIQAIADYCAEFPENRMRVTLDEKRIPGLDYLETYDSIPAWLQFCETMSGKISWYMTVRETDNKPVGFICIRHKLEYDDDDPEFASHIGYSVRPSERRNGYAAEQLRLGLLKAGALGIETVRIVCRDINTGSIRTILANGGRFIDTLYGEESGLYVNRYDIPLK